MAPTDKPVVQTSKDVLLELRVLHEEICTIDGGECEMMALVRRGADEIELLRAEIRERKFFDNIPQASPELIAEARRQGKLPPAETGCGGWTVEEYRNGDWQRCAMGQAWQTNADAHQQCRELQERYPKRVFGVTTLKALEPRGPVLTRVCPGCNTVHSGPLCPTESEGEPRG
jgi:hypothetical protein